MARVLWGASGLRGTGSWGARVARVARVTRVAKVASTVTRTPGENQHINLDFLTLNGGFRYTLAEI